ncbi:MAG: hypothetical protein Q9195_004454 [Heterodermia aff. obscurata]
MNWTGGALPRSRNGNAKASLTATQKKHFAKVRNKILNGPQSSPKLDFSGLDHANGQDGPPRKRLHHALGRRSKSSSQTKLESYKHIAPLAFQLSTIKPRHDPLNSHHNKPSSLRRRHKPDTSPQSPSLSYSGFKEPHSQPFASVGKDTTRDPHVPPNFVAAQDSFESSRQAVLRKQDWVGLANSRPAKIQFIDAKDRLLIGKRRRLEDTDAERYQHRKPKRNVIPYHGQAPSSIGDISVRIGHLDRPGHEQQHSMASSHQDGSVADSVDEMLLDNDCLSAQSVQSYNQGKSPRRQKSDISPLLPKRTTPIERQDYSGSVQISWAGFSPRSNGNAMPAQENPASEINDTGASGTTPAQGEIRKRSQVTGSAHDRVNAPKSLEQKAWMHAPGLPLIFKGSPQKPIDISSDSSSEAYSTTPSNSQIIVEKIDPKIHKRLDLQLHETSQEQKLELTAPPMNDKSTLAAITVRETLLEPTQEQERQSYLRAPNVILQPRTMIPPAQTNDTMKVPITKVPELIDSLPAVSEVSKELEKPAKNLLSPIQGTTGGSSLADEELIWRKFVFGDNFIYEEGADENEPKKPPKRTGSASNESSLLTALSESPGRSSLSAQASSASVGAHRLGSTHTNRDLRQTEAAATFSSTDSDISFPSLQAEASLPTTDEAGQHVPLSSIIAHASTSSSPSRSHQLAPSLSADELATTPAKPTFYFRKPSRYMGTQLNGSAAVQLGKGKVKPEEQEEDAGEDDIVDT